MFVFLFFCKILLNIQMNKYLIVAIIKYQGTSDDEYVRRSSLRSPPLVKLKSVTNSFIYYISVQETHPIFVQPTKVRHDDT